MYESLNDWFSNSETFARKLLINKITDPLHLVHITSASTPPLHHLLILTSSTSTPPRQILLYHQLCSCVYCLPIQVDAVSEIDAELQSKQSPQSKQVKSYFKQNIMFSLQICFFVICYCQFMCSFVVSRSLCVYLSFPYAVCRKHRDILESILSLQ